MKVLIAKVGLDGHDRGAIAVTKALQASGFEATFSGIRRTSEEVAALAVRLDVDCVGLSSLAGAHMTAFPKVLAALEAVSWRGLMLAGGIIPDEDAARLRQIGFAAVFGPNAATEDIVATLRSARSHGIESQNEVV
ncbi:cobalamin-dependent protein [Paenibacillus sp. TRM 82003]|nr:cobalamin-dependent protein [Paenibacillus sp. TRM 82003]